MTEICTQGCDGKQVIRYRKIGYIEEGKGALVDPVEGNGVSMMVKTMPVQSFKVMPEGFAFETVTRIYLPIQGGAKLYWTAKTLHEKLMKEKEATVEPDPAKI